MHSRSQLHLTVLLASVMLSYCLKVTPQQMINLDNVTKHDHDTSSQLDRFDPVLKAGDDYAKYIIFWVNAYQLCLTILDMWGA